MAASAQITKYLDDVIVTTPHQQIQLSFDVKSGKVKQIVVREYGQTITKDKAYLGHQISAKTFSKAEQTEKHCLK